MELISLEGLTLGSVIAGLFQAAILVGVGKIFHWVNGNRIGGHLLFLASNRFIWRTCTLAILSFVFAKGLSAVAPDAVISKIDPSLVGLTTFSLLLVYSQWKFAAGGLHAAQLSVERGTDYRAALSLCKNRFSFLGTGAFKLTQERNFEATMLRCNHDVTPVRFLLSSPDNKIIFEAERKAGVAKGTYEHKLISSLKVLKRLRDEKGANFEVKFYKGETERDFENFRMMFIDDDVLLLSYNVYGSGDGRQTGQLVLFKGTLSSSTNNFYFAFQNYFERLWASSEAWDFEKHV